MIDRNVSDDVNIICLGMRKRGGLHDDPEVCGLNKTENQVENEDNSCVFNTLRSVSV